MGTPSLLDHVIVRDKEFLRPARLDRVSEEEGGTGAAAFVGLDLDPDSAEEMLVRGLSCIDDGVWNVYFGPLKLGRLLEKHMRIEDAFGRLIRHKCVTHVPGLFCYLSPRPLISLGEVLQERIDESCDQSKVPRARIGHLRFDTAERECADWYVELRRWIAWRAGRNFYVSALPRGGGQILEQRDELRPVLHICPSEMYGGNTLFIEIH